MSALTFPRQPRRRTTRRLTSWWGRAFARAAEETAYDDAQLLAARALARSGRLGGLVVDRGRFATGVSEEAGLWTVTGSVPPFGDDERQAFLEVVAGRAELLLDGELPHDLVEHAEEAGVELVPYGGELGTTCTCPGWRRASRHGGACEHAVAVLLLLADLLDADPLVLLHLRGVTREDLRPLRGEPTDADPDPAAFRDEDVEVAADAALRAARLLAEVRLDGSDAPPAAPAAR
ncbi:SWIM zinc finger family protein [Nocardioides sp.]|jgi:uncharacterized Zn finger protein|uniref:SWIM zinc finger family protein n=1 Tax=Nocardioides sp. TaxID=35761 RepID=UPI002C559A1A|nr:SWIM zinc finger family protein [Nocardioides sp.]HVX55679.1 SWIM zinc finger family protein [Nocardioides sp.]